MPSEFRNVKGAPPAYLLQPLMFGHFSSLKVQFRGLISDSYGNLKTIHFLHPFHPNPDSPGTRRKNQDTNHQTGWKKGSVLVFTGQSTQQNFFMCASPLPVWTVPHVCAAIGGGQEKNRKEISAPVLTSSLRTKWTQHILMNSCELILLSCRWG